MVHIKKNHDLGMLLLRLSVGVVFIAHGWAKFSDLAGTMAFFSQLSMPPILAYVVAAIELLGGIALVIGIYTDLAALLLAVIMAVALVYVKMVTFKMGLVGGYEFDLVLLASLLAVIFIGPGRHVALKGRA